MKDATGLLSSKRFGFIRSLNHWIAMGWVTLIWLLIKEEYELAVNLVEAAAITTCFFAGFVACEIFKNFQSKKDGNN